MAFPISEDQFPIEIFETIIDFLADQDNSLPSIKASSLVCHNFLPITRKHLFGTLTLNITASSKTPDRFVHDISGISEIVKYVHTLNFRILLEDLSVKGLPETLKKLTMLKSLTIYQELYDDAWNWSDIPLLLKDALFHLFRLPTLSHLTLGPINGLVIPDLAFHSSLKYLNIRNVRLAPVNLQARKYYRPLLGYADEDDDLCTGRKADGTLVIDFSSYHVMELVLDTGLQSKMKALFAQCSQLMNIRTHKFNYGKASMLIKGSADVVLPSLQSLEHLHFQIMVTREYNDTLGGLPAELAAMTGKNVIESISILVIIELDYHHRRLDNEWGDLDRALTQHQLGWPNLKNVTLILETNTYGRKEGDWEKALKKLPESHLGGLARSKDIKLDFKVTCYFYSTEDSDSESSG